MHPSICSIKEKMNALKCRTLGVDIYGPYVFNAHARFAQENGRPNVWLSAEECWISATERFQRKPHKYFDLRCLLSMRQYFQDEQMLQR